MLQEQYQNLLPRILLVYMVLRQFTILIITPSAAGTQPCCNAAAVSEAHTGRVPGSHRKS